MVATRTEIFLAKILRALKVLQGMQRRSGTRLTTTERDVRSPFSKVPVLVSCTVNAKPGNTVTPLKSAQS
jgi:hypothetical protein